MLSRKSKKDRTTVSVTSRISIDNQLQAGRLAYIHFILMRGTLPEETI